MNSIIEFPVRYNAHLESIARAENGCIVVGWQFVERATPAQQIAILLHEEGHLVDMPSSRMGSAARELWAWQYALEMLEFFDTRYPDPVWVEAYCYACDAIKEYER